MSVDHYSPPTSFQHRYTRINGIKIHYVEEGVGPTIVLLHGFPYLWYMWRHQIHVFAKAGYRVIAPDIRGFGQTDSPKSISSYSMLHCVADLVGLMDVLGTSSAVLVGHDLGAWIAYASAQVRPDLFSSLILLNTPVTSRETIQPRQKWKELREITGKLFYQDYFQKEGLAEEEMNSDIRKTILHSHYSISGSAKPEHRWRLFLKPEETFMNTISSPDEPLDWLPADVIDYYTSEYSRHGFRGPLNHYRMRDRNWAQLAFLHGCKVRQPSIFIGGADDPACPFFMPHYENLDAHLLGLRYKTLVAGVGHSAAEEQPETINRAILEFMDCLPH